MNYTVVSLKDARDRFSELIERAALVRETEEKFSSEKQSGREALKNFIGIWKNRRDITDGGRWVSNRRKLESLRLTNKLSS